jgi:RNA polymerase sigma factor (sigma-70 family)
VAAKKYREIYAGLVKLFCWRGYYDAEELADEVIDRVIVKAQGLAETYVGDPASYFFGVAKNVVRERDRRQPQQLLDQNLQAIDEPVEDNEPSEGLLMRECLNKCLRTLDGSDRELVLLYYQETKQPKIAFRKALAEQLRIETNALRVRVYRARARLKLCVEECVKKRKQ